jgi:hypothetical protein
MSECQCKEHGFCPRRNAYVPRHQWKQCQEGRVEYVDAVISALQEKVEYAARKALSDEKKEERRKRVVEAKERKTRLISWLKFLRIPEDSGIGDTAHRLNMKSCKSPDAHEQLESLLKQCSCRRIDAVTRLNTEYPY